MSLFQMHRAFNKLHWHVDTNPKDLIARQALDNFIQGLRYIGGTRLVEFAEDYKPFRDQKLEEQRKKKKKYVKREEDSEDDYYN
jgi:hypothetical protein